MNSSSQSPSISFSKRVCIAVSITVFFFCLIWLVGASFNVLLLTLASVLIALPLRAGARWLSRKTGWREGTALVALGLTGLVLLVLMGMLVVAPISEQAQAVQQELPSVWQNARKQIEQNNWGRQLLAQIPQSPDKLLQANGGGNRVVGQVFGAVSGTINTFADIYVLFFLALFLVAEPQLYIGGMLKLIPPSGRSRAAQVLDKLNEGLLGWLLGTIVSMVLVGLLSWIGLSLLGVRLAGILALFAALITFIPNLGPVLALVPALLFALLDGPGQALNVFLLYAGIQFVESNLITPLVQKRLNDIPPALLLIVQIVVGGFAGTLGLIMAAPLLVIVMVLVQMLYQEDMLNEESNGG